MKNLIALLFLIPLSFLTYGQETVSKLNPIKNGTENKTLLGHEIIPKMELIPIDKSFESAASRIKRKCLDTNRTIYFGCFANYQHSTSIIGCPIVGSTLLPNSMYQEVYVATKGLSVQYENAKPKIMSNDMELINRNNPIDMPIRFIYFTSKMTNYTYLKQRNNSPMVSL